MDKAYQIKDFSVNYSRQTDKDRELFSLILNKLLKTNFICRDNPKDKDSYYDAFMLRDEIRNYLSVIDLELIADEVNGVIGLKVLGDGHYRLRLHETLILLTLRKLFFAKKQSISSLDDIVITMEELMQELWNTGHFDKMLGKTEIDTILKTFKSFHLLDYSFAKNPDIIILWPSILYAVNAKTMEEIQAKIELYKENLEVMDEDPETN